MNEATKSINRQISILFYNFNKNANICMINVKDMNSLIFMFISKYIYSSNMIV